MDKSIRIFIATPLTYSLVFRDWFVACTRLNVPAGATFHFEESMPLDINRTNCVKRAQEFGATHLFFLDHDNLLEPDTLDRLASFNLDIVGSLYFMRHRPHPPVMCMFSEDFSKLKAVATYPKGLVQADLCGLGACLIRMSVFDRISEPWFGYECKGLRSGTEDIIFFQKLKEAGIKVFVDTERPIGHISTYTVTEEDWLSRRDDELRRQAERNKQKIP